MGLGQWGKQIKIIVWRFLSQQIKAVDSSEPPKVV